jgi:polysaccharide export outer membrane protein
MSMSGRSRARVTLRIALACATGVLVAACDLPRGAPIQGEVLAGADNPEAGFAVMPVTRATLSTISTWPLASPRTPDRWVPRSRGPISPVIATGDRLNLTIWDSEENSLLSNAAQKQVQMGEMVVGASGTIFVPYVEEVRVAGLTPEAARRAIQEELRAIVPSGQVQLALVSGRHNSVDVVSGVGTPGTYPLADRNTTVLSVLSAAGGVPPDMRNPQVRLIRGSDRYGIALNRLYDEPQLDTTLRGGDKIIVEPDNRHFLALGASGREQVVYFPKDELSVLDAVTLMGGLNDTRGNPRGVLILRRYPGPAVRTDGTGPSNERMVFTVDLTSADGLFSAGEFQIQPGDLVLATESPVTAAQTILGLIGTTVRLGQQLQ